VRFKEQHLEIFGNLSYDKSPIHWDKVYAHRTPMANIVVYGIASVIHGLGLWANGRSFSLRKIKGQFRRALYIGIDYDFLIDEKDNKATIKVARKNSILMEFTFEWEPWGSQQQPTQSKTQFIALENANTNSSLPTDLSHFHYCCNYKALKDFNSLYSLDYQQLPFKQFLSLLWSSYQVGMVWPGTQALYTNFDFRFDTGESHDHMIALDNVRYKLDKRFNMASIIGEGEELFLEIAALIRPKPVNYDLDAIAREIEVDEKFTRKNILVLGASRGFGSVLSRGFLLKGANVAINYRSEGEDIDDLKKQLSRFKSRVSFVKGDISDQTDCNVLKDSIKQHLGRLDYLVCNASPQIMAFPFQEMSTEEFTDFVLRSISVIHRPLQTLIPVLHKRATVIIISSIYAAQPSKQFSHYVTAKRSLEGMAHALACEFPDLNFVIARLPRMLTDQTNISFDLESKISAITVASGLLARILQNSSNERPFVVNL
jgi:NAD(P)-dependent dehydrogenase (short-subunit alcohol dehydrogenase family)